ncbi:MAG: CDP-diacylglycerol--serine O-phosphatidyltransferase [Bacteroidales bacterium]|nr:CDP-diacylglycerol--serine O-phosphatidyltransferase [Bacteroidales bacterium]MDD3201968.1 CDP-diacylglycerol--serine O-phosphatidyltransferase [Bacteroidales bacterium]
MKKHIPNILTLMNLICGCAAVILTLWEQHLAAFLFILCAAVFDFSDGFFARLLNAYSDTGKELDSLADLVSFGLAPSLMFFTWYYKFGHECSLLAFVPLLIVALSALRLAKFNLDTRQSVNFIGLATPANAIFIASLVAYGDIMRHNATASVVVNLLNSTWFIPTASIILSLLLVSEIPMFSLKKKKLSFKQYPFETIFFILVIILTAGGIILFPDKPFPIWIALILGYYIIYNCLLYICVARRPKKTAQTTDL